MAQRRTDRPGELRPAANRVFVWAVMAGEKWTIWCNAKLPAEAMARLIEGVGGHRLVIAEQVVNNVEPSRPDPRLPEAEIAFGQPDWRQVIELDRLKWVQLSSAGYARYDRPEVREALAGRGAMLSNSSSVFAEPCAQHALAFILSAARQLPAALEAQRGERWWRSAEIRARSRLLNGQSVLILGYGAIARRLIELLAPLQMNVTAVRRSVRGDEAVRTRPMEELDALLPQADHVVNILPASGSTRRLFDGPRLARLKAGAVFYNIGRGDMVESAALIQGLAKGRPAAAYLDVTDPEPPGPDDPLWTAPHCFITPHTAGGDDQEFARVVEHFLENLRRWQTGQPPRDRVY